MTQVEPISWAITALIAGIERRDDIASVWNVLSTRLQRQRVAMLGLSGSGKSTLLDDFEGKTGKTGYRPPETSFNTDGGNVGSWTTRRARVLAVPGINATLRTSSLVEVFQDKPLKGVIYVVSDGIASIRDDVARSQLVQHGIDTPQKLQNHIRDEEINGLGELAKLVSEHYAKFRKTMFVSILVNKYDLFGYDKQRRDDAQSFYDINGNSRFSRSLQNLRNTVGSINLHVATDPIAAWPVDFNWNGHVVNSNLDRLNRDMLTIRYLNKLERLLVSLED
jgi:hypothetical protein